MCGIAGIFQLNGAPNASTIHSMVDCQAHRGPDDSGYFTDETYQTGHRRLSIIDLSKRAAQPMTSRCGRYVITYNGELYNYKELGAELLKNGIQLQSDSDTEVILEGIAHFGWGFITRMNGMFSIAYYDKSNCQLHLIRDRFGIKPLFYYIDATKIAFSSELKAIESIPDKHLSIDRMSIADFLHTGFIPAPNTIYTEIKKLLPGERMVIGKQGIINTIPFHRLGQNVGKEKISDEQQAAERLDLLLTKSVSLQLRSDVPCGIFLSGGIDSSMIAFKAAQASQNKINTFTIGNKEVVSDESRFAKKVAQAIGTNHHELIIGESDIIDLIEDGIDTYDEPLADASIIPTLLVSGLACQHVKVVLSGEGADELFMGYGAHKWSNRLHNPVFRFLSALSVPVLKTLPSRYVRIAELLSLRNSRGFKDHIFSQEQYFFTSKEIDSLLKKEFSSNTLKHGFRFEQRIQEELYFASTARDLSPCEEQAFFDLEHYLPDDLLTKIDRATMKHSIEARVPFLDNDLAAFALNLDDKLKIKSGNSKYLLKKVLFKHLDQSLFDRPKSGFSIPLVRWLKSDLKYLVEKYLSDEMILKANLVDPEYVKHLVKQYHSGMHHLFNRIWALVVLHRWMERKGGFIS